MLSKADEIVVSSTSPMPNGYILVRKGNVYLTSNCRKKTHESGRKLYVVLDNKKKPIGIRCPRTIFTTVLNLNRETKPARRAAVEKKETRLNDKAQEQILTSFPSIPVELIPDILKHTLRKRSGRVGRTSTLPFDKSIDLAVRAFIRHKLTEYDLLLRQGMKQQKAREQIREKSEKVVEKWKASPVKGKGGKKVSI